MKHTSQFTQICIVAFALASAVFAPAGVAQIAPQSAVGPANLPLPLPGAAPMPPDKLRADNPWSLPMTGAWKFKLTHGQIIAGQFAPSAGPTPGVSCSSAQTEHPPRDAFDGLEGTRWCASGPDFPAWLQADLGAPHNVTGVTVVWERPTEKYRFQIEGSLNGKTWTSLAVSPKAGLTSGPVRVILRSSQYIRITTLGSSGGGWASIRECAIHYTENGADVTWRPQKQVAPSAAHNDDFAQKNFADAGWDTIPVPSNWEMLGYSLPTYNSVDDTVGLYRRWVDIPKDWAGKDIAWRFDGALDGTEVYVNGQRISYHESGYTGFDVDLGKAVIPGRKNLFAVRVSKKTPSVACETGDYQTMGGIYRDTYLIATPPTHISDITVRTPLTDNYKDCSLTAQVEINGTPGGEFNLSAAVVDVHGKPLPERLYGKAIIGADGAGSALLNAKIKGPRLWSAEKPNLYYLVVNLSRGSTPIERTEQRFGFRQVEIKNDIVLWNGVPIKCEGTCRHDEWADKGWALTDKEWNRDITLMKLANINAVRTSHYNHAPRFLELCAERGLYILDEVPFCWIGDKVNDPKFAPALLQRTDETVERDKNRPCVLAWSLGNENPVGSNTQLVRNLVQHLDPTRPAFASEASPSQLKGQDFFDMHYPSPDRVDHYVATDSQIAPAVFTEQPHIFYEKETQDYDPGASDLWTEALQKTWDKIWAAPTILGSFIWEWQNQGIADKNKDTTTDFWYGPDRLRQENNKGIVDAYRNRKPEWWIVKNVYSPIVAAGRTVTPVNGHCTVHLTNRYSFTDLKETTCRWTALRGDTTLATALVHVPCAPRSEADATFPAPEGMTTLRLAFTHPDGTNIVTVNLAVPGSPEPKLNPPPVGNALAAQDGPNILTIKNNLMEIAFDKHTAVIRYWRVNGHNLLLPGGPILNLGEAKAGSEKGYYYSQFKPVTDGATVSASPRDDGAVQVSAKSFVFAKNGGVVLGTLTSDYTINRDATIQVKWSMSWLEPEAHLWESGLQFPTPSNESTMRWYRDSYFTDYPAGHLGEPTGECKAGDPLFLASKRDLHWLSLTDAGGIGIALVQSGAPLVGRAQADAVPDHGSLLFASREVAGPQTFSHPWVAEHDIVVSPTKPLSGEFELRAVGM